jgi:Na+-translocating ferredoxin:NAD+ oxidoreductase subunit G
MATRNDSALRPFAAALTLALIAGAVAAALTLIADLTGPRSARNEQAWVAQRIDALLSELQTNNDVLTDAIAVVAPELLGASRPVTIYRARRDGRPVAAVLRTVAPDGYRGPIELLVAVAYDGTLVGVQVLRHSETPGLGDAFQTRDRDWLDKFRGLSLSNPAPPGWTVRKDGGEFDAFTGATVTPRAIVKAVRRTLEYHAANKERIFALPATDDQ